ncbi:hypothetical protein UVI_02016780 [Ustilaginoidea virens]|uniref:Uncharacterized protein n=1 Tax=Ustilaginoidea virens TaxID=1159556 RepID=A0A1B5KZ42_USTVR|nr:hypothetical protein UVI_02016780 [Ustilaginoidea virens]
MAGRACLKFMESNGLARKRGKGKVGAGKEPRPCLPRQGACLQLSQHQSQTSGHHGGPFLPVRLE